MGTNRIPMAIGVPPTGKIGFTICLAFLCLYCSAQVNRTGIEWMDLIGGVKSVQQYEYQIDPLVNSKVTMVSIEAHYYDRDGNDTEAARYKATKEVISFVKYSYDNNDKWVEEKVYTPDGNLSYSDKFKYDSAGNMNGENQYSPEGTSLSWTEIDCDANGNIVNEDMYETNGPSLGSAAYTYNSRGQVVSYISRKADGGIEIEDSNLYNNKGNIIETDRYDARGNVQNKYTYSYVVFDKTGNWTRRMDYTNGRQTGMTYRNLVYGDDMSRLALAKKYLAQGNLK